MSVCSPAALESDRGWLKTVVSQTSCILIRRERQAGLRALRMTDVSAMPAAGWWGCGSHQRLTASKSRLLSLPHFCGVVFPPPLPMLVLAVAALTSPSTCCLSSLQASGLAPFPPSQPQVPREPVPSTIHPTQRSQAHVGSMCKAVQICAKMSRTAVLIPAQQPPQSPDAFMNTYTPAPHP